MGREQRGQRGVPRPRQHERAVVIDLREPDAAVLLGHLHPQRAERLEAVDDPVGDPRRLLDLERIDLLDEELAEAGGESLALLDRRRVDTGAGMDEVEPQVAEEELLAEAGLLPALLAGALGDLSRFLLADLAGHVDSLSRGVGGEYPRDRGIGLAVRRLRKDNQPGDSHMLPANKYVLASPRNTTRLRCAGWPSSTTPVR